MAGSVTVYEISELIGKEITQKLIDEYGGKSCFFTQDPMALEFPNKPERNEVIRNLFNSGNSIPKLSNRFELSVNHVRKIINNR